MNMQAQLPLTHPLLTIRPPTAVHSTAFPNSSPLTHLLEGVVQLLTGGVTQALVDLWQGSEAEPGHCCLVHRKAPLLCPHDTNLTS